MPRALRIEYENANYHVMNRGRGREEIFPERSDYQAFLKILSETHKRFGIQIQSYCLMSNHYHLQIKTPEGNLGRAMRHINGVYTQRYNKKQKTDGPLFRGRYKSILVEEDSYQLQLSRYIHLNPVEAKLVETPEQYEWSSYCTYIEKEAVPEWLYPDEVKHQLNTQKNAGQKYQKFVGQGVDEKIKQFYGKNNLMPFIGSKAFRDWAYKKIVENKKDFEQKVIRQFRPDIETIIKTVSKAYKVSIQSIKQSQRGRVQVNIPRWVAMYLAQQKADARLKEIASAFELKSVGSIPITTQKLKALMDENKQLRIKVEKMISE